MEGASEGFVCGLATLNRECSRLFLSGDIMALPLRKAVPPLPTPPTYKPHVLSVSLQYVHTVGYLL